MSKAIPYVQHQNFSERIANPALDRAALAGLNSINDSVQAMKPSVKDRFADKVRANKDTAVSTVGLEHNKPTFVNVDPRSPS